MNVTICPSCENRINLSGHLLVGQIVYCQKCYEVFKIASTNPLTLDFIDAEPEDGFNNLPKPITNGKKSKKGQKVDFDDIADIEFQHSKRVPSTKTKNKRKKKLDFEDFY